MLEKLKFSSPSQYSTGSKHTSKPSAERLLQNLGHTKNCNITNPGRHGSEKFCQLENGGPKVSGTNSTVTFLLIFMKLDPNSVLIVVRLGLNRT